MTTAQGTITLDDARATGSATTSFRDAVVARLAAELDDASRWLSPTPDPFDGSEVVGDVGNVGDAPNDEDRDVRQAEEQAAREQKDAADLAAAIVTVRASFDVIVDATERMVDELVDVVVKGDALRPIIKARIRPDLVAWPTPWVRPREGTWVGADGQPGRRAAFAVGLAGGEERAARQQHPELSALARIVAEREARRHLVGEPGDLDALQEARRVLSAYGRDVVASFAWRAIGDAAEAGAALRLAARLAGVDLGKTALPLPPDPRADGPRLARGDVDHVEVPGVGWAYASTLALVGRALWEATRPAELAALAARAVLDEAGNDELARRPEAHRTLAREVEDWLSRAPTCSDEVDVVESVHPFDEALAALLDSIGKTGRKLGGEVRGSRKSPKDRADRWRPYVDPLRVPRLLARVLWRDVVASRVERMANPVAAPGLVLPAVTNLVGMSRRGAQQSLLSTQSADILDHRGRRVGALHLTPEIDANLVTLANLGKLSTTRLVRFLLHRTHEQKWILEQHNANRVDVEGGFAALAEILGMGGKKAPDELHEAAATLSAIWLDSPGGEGRVFGFFNHKIGRTRLLEMTAMGPFAPDYAARTLAGHRGDARDKQLVPVPLPQSLPPLVGRDRDRGAQALQQLLVLREMRTRAVEMVETGTVEIGARQWEELRNEANVPKAILPAVLDAYLTGDDEGRPAFLRSPSPGRYALADAYARERDAILQAGEAMRAGAKGGRKAAAGRRAGSPTPKRRGKVRAD